MSESPKSLGVGGEEPVGERSLGSIQRRIELLYGSKDRARGEEATFLWFMEEVGELASALRAGTDREVALEMADVFAWLATLANLRGIDLESAVWQKYGTRCPGCGQVRCGCDPTMKR